MGVPLEYSLVYASDLGVDVHIIVIGSLERTDLARYKEKLSGLAVWHEAAKLEDLDSILIKLSG